LNDLSLHLAPNAPWVWLALASLLAALLGLWAYRIAVPPLPASARRALPALRIAALLVLVWLLGQPVLERPAGGRRTVVVLLDRSASMALPERAGGGPRAAAADRAAQALARAWRGRAQVEVRGFASRLLPDSARGARGGAAPPPGTGSTALGDALAQLAESPLGQDAGAVVVVSDGAVNAGADPVAAARALGMPVHAVVVGQGRQPDRVVTEVETDGEARVGRPVMVRARVTSSEERGTPLAVRLGEEGRELGRAVVVSPGPGMEATAEFSVVPVRPGLAVWEARVDSLAGDLSHDNDARSLAVEVSPGKLGMVLVSAGLNWDLSFMRRALAGDSSLALSTWVRERGGWRRLEPGGPRSGAPDAAVLRGQAVVVLDAILPAEVGAGFDRALADFVRGGGGLLLLGGPAPGLARYRAGALGPELGVTIDPTLAGRGGAPQPAPEASDLLAWDVDPARGERAWRAAAPLSDLAPVRPGPGDRVLIASTGGGPPLLLSRHVGRGQALLLNGTGFWRWSLSGVDELAADRGRVLWRRLAHWLAEPAQAEPLRVRPERWLAAGGEPVRLFATLQDDAFRPVADAAVTGEAHELSPSGAPGRAFPVGFAARAAGAYEASLEGLPPGRYRVEARAVRGGRELGRATSEFAVDRWSLEVARALPDSAGLAAVAAATGGRVGAARDVERWARSLPARELTRARTESLRLWESPWLFGLVVGALAVEWFWRRRRGLP
jgi:hypothetical protein